MSDLVGNPNCWFSHAQAHLSDLLIRRISLCSSFYEHAQKMWFPRILVTFGE